jgi:hypothetical protein
MLRVPRAEEGSGLRVFDVHPVNLGRSASIISPRRRSSSARHDRHRVYSLSGRLEEDRQRGPAGAGSRSDIALAVLWFFSARPSHAFVTTG